jgi:transposase IS166 family protein
MTAVEIARARLARTTAKRATPKKRIAKTSLRQDDSGTQSALEGAAESALARTMTTTADALPPQLPDDIGALRALILTERAAHAATMAERTQLAERIAIVERANAKLEHIIAELKRAQFGRRSERITDDQLALAPRRAGDGRRPSQCRGREGGSGSEGRRGEAICKRSSTHRCATRSAGRCRSWSGEPGRICRRAA